MIERFRIFRAGINRLSKGTFVFDDKAAAAVMADFKRAGVDIMIDLEHLSTDQESNAYNPDAQGWCKLSLVDGELWATDVKWTPEGEERLSKAKQRYISPWFSYDTKTNRIQKIANIALCAMPATYDAQALVAASKKFGEQLATLSIGVDEMSLDEFVAKIGAMLGLASDATAEQVMAAIEALVGDDGDGGEESASEEDDDKKKKDEAKASDDDEAKVAASMSPKAAARYLAAIRNATVAMEKASLLEKRIDASELDTLIAKNVNKFTPATEKWARGQSLDVVKEYVKAAKDVTGRHLAEPGTKSGQGEPSAFNAEELTPDELRMGKKAGLTKEKMIAAKKKIAERDEEKRMAMGR